MAQATLVSFLGTGNYASTCYDLNGQQCQTRYIAAALATFLRVDHIIVLTTEQAYASHAHGLREELARLGLPNPDIRQIPSGGSSTELWEQFDIIRHAVTDSGSSSVSFDITHGFRAQPFFAAAVISYLRSTLDDVPDMQAFYGEWRKDEPSSSVWDISAFIDLLNWSNALQGFTKTGHAGALATLAKAENARIHKSGASKRPKRLKVLADTLQDFSSNMATVRCQALISGDEHTRGSAQKVLRVIAESRAEVDDHLKPLAPVLDKLERTVAELASPTLFGEHGRQAMSALANLYLDYARYPEAAIVVREGWISQHADTQKNDDDLMGRDERDATEKRWFEKEENLAKALASVRNDIQHGGFNPEPNPADALIRDVKKFAVQFHPAHEGEA